MFRSGFQFGLQYAAQPGERLSHSGVDCARGDLEDLGDFRQFHILVMPQHNHRAINIRKLQHSFAHQFAFFERGCPGVGAWAIGSRFGELVLLVLWVVVAQELWCDILPRGILSH